MVNVDRNENHQSRRKVDFNTNFALLHNNSSLLRQPLRTKSHEVNTCIKENNIRRIA